MDCDRALCNKLMNKKKKQDHLASFLRWSWIEMRPVKASIPPVGEVWNVSKIQRAALHCIATKSDTWALVEAPAKNQSQKL